MYIVILFSIIALLLTYLESKGALKGGMGLGFILVTILSAIHYDYGNDYMSYYGLYTRVENTPFVLDNLFNGYFHRDSGWVLLNYIFKPIGGFFALVCVLSILQNFIIYKFIKREVPKQWHLFAVYIYLMTTSFYLMSFSMLRQWLVMCLFLGSWTFIKNRKWVVALLIILLCTLIHDSSRVLIPFVFWGYLPVKRGKVLAFIWLTLMFVIRFSGGLVEDGLSVILSSGEFDLYLDRYGENNTTFSLGLGFFIQLLPFVFAEVLLFKNRGTDNEKRLVLLAMLSYLISPLAYYLPMVGRIGFYFSIFNIAALPIIYRSIANKYIRISLILIVIFIYSYDYFIFFNNPVWAEKYSTFKTIFSVIS